MYKLKTNVNFPEIYTSGTKDHSKLSNLDYNNSGHIGFASSEDLENKVDKVSGKQLSTEDYTTEEKNKLNSLENYDDTQIKENINEIESKIPAQASNTNQLADKEFVNSSISTNTATFRGTYNTLEELQQQEADINDYGFVISTDSSGNTLYNRYKYTGEEWVFEYSLNNSSFTANQWASINSGITSEKVSKIGENETNISNLETNKVDKITGKGLSENDYTNEEKEKLASLENYTLPIASSDVLGGIKIGENLTVDENGVVSASGGGSGSISPIIIGEAELKELHDTYTPALAENQIWAGAVYLKYGDGLFYCNTSFSMGWGKYASSDYGDIGSVILVTQQGKCIFHFLSHKSKAMKIFASDSTITESSTYSTATIAGIQLYTLINKIASNKVMYKDNTVSYTPTSDYNPSTKLYTDKTHYENIAGYDATATQVLKNVNGTLQWISE